MKQLLTISLAILLTVSLYFSYQSLQTIQALNNRINRANAEYQFVISDSAQITVFDHNRYVGTVKLEGQLDSLIVADNQ